jgi:tripartite ATP-independent transporter DctM subunit
MSTGPTPALRAGLVPEPAVEPASALAVAGIEPQPASARTAGVRRVVDGLAIAVLLIAFVGELAVVVVNVLLRKISGGALAWEPEVTQFGLAIFAFIGGAFAYGRGSSFAIGYFVGRLPKYWQRRVSDGVDALIVVVSLLQLSAQWNLLGVDRPLPTPVLHVSQAWLVAPLLAGTVLFAVYGILRLADRWAGRATLASVAAVALVAAVLTAYTEANGYFLALDSVNPLTVVIFVVLLVFSVPVPFVLLTTSATLIATAGLADNLVVPQTVTASTASFLYVAVPFFVFAGLLMANSGVSGRIASFVAALVGRLPGGLYQAIVVTMYLFSGLSGSKLADTVAIGSPVGKMVDQHGYEREEAAAVLSASAVMGETVPPSLAIIILGSVTSLSIGTMFLAGLLPAAAIALCLMLFIVVRARRRAAGQTAVGWSLRTIARTGIAAAPAMIIPVVLIGGIVGGVATPTEVSSFAALCGLALLLIYRTSLSSLWDTLVKTLQTVGMVLFLLSTASVFSWLLAFGQVPQHVSDWIIGHVAQPWLFLLLSILALVLFGAVLEGAAALIILAPLLLPVATDLHINGVQYGLVLIIAMGIGSHIPPIGIGMYVACASLEVEVERTTRRYLSYLAVLFVGVLLIAFVPQLTTFLPNLFGKS